MGGLAGKSAKSQIRRDGRKQKKYNGIYHFAIRKHMGSSTEQIMNDPINKVQGEISIRSIR